MNLFFRKLSKQASTLVALTYEAGAIAPPDSGKIKKSSGKLPDMFG